MHLVLRKALASRLQKQMLIGSIRIQRDVTRDHSKNRNRKQAGKLEEKLFRRSKNLPKTNKERIEKRKKMQKFNKKTEKLSKTHKILRKRF